MRHKKRLNAYWRVQFYRTASGKVPFKKWYKTLDTSWRARVFRRLERLEYYGELGDHKKLSAPGFFWEMRFRSGPGYRIYGGIIDGEIYIFIGGHKSSQKRDIGLARKYYLETLRGEYEKI